MEEARTPLDSEVKTQAAAWLARLRADDRTLVDEEAFQAWATGPAVEAHAGQRANPVATGASLLEFEVVLDVAGTGAKA